MRSGPTRGALGNDERATRVFAETLLPTSNKPLQLLTSGEHLRSIHGLSYTRLWNIDLVNLMQEFAVDFRPPQEGFNGATGLYAGEQDLFAFLIDPTGWTEIEGEAFALLSVRTFSTFVREFSPFQSMPFPTWETRAVVSR